MGEREKNGRARCSGEWRDKKASTRAGVSGERVAVVGMGEEGREREGVKEKPSIQMLPILDVCVVGSTLLGVQTALMCSE